MRIPLSKPSLGKEEEALVLSVLRSGQLTRGPILRQFEQEFAEYLGVKHAVGVSSGTAALHIALLSLGIEPGDEVITTPFSFVASVNAILYVRARPVFVDIDPKTYNIDVNKIEDKITPQTKAILPVHVFGVPCDMDRLMELCEFHNLFLLEDACESLGATYGKNKLGSFGHASVFSGYPNKNITWVEGGMFCTDDDDISRLARMLRNQGRDESTWLTHHTVGYNYRLSDVHSAIGLAQLRKIEEINKKRDNLARYYTMQLRNLPLLTPFHLPGRVWFVYVIELEEDRDAIMSGLRERGIECKPYFQPIHLQPYYRKAQLKGRFPVCEEVSKRVLALPFYTGMAKNEVKVVVEALKAVL